MPNSDGQLIEIEEGRLSTYEPPAPPTPRKQNKRWHRKDYTTRPLQSQRGKNNSFVKLCESVPGMKEWASMRRDESRRLNPEAQGRYTGGTVGYTKRAADNAWKEASKLAKRDMEEIKKKINLSDAAEEALQVNLEIMRGPVSVADKLKAAAEVLKYTMSKPVAKTEVTVSSFDQLIAQIGEDEAPESTE